MTRTHLPKLLRKSASEERVEYNDCLIQVPQKDALKKRKKKILIEECSWIETNQTINWAASRFAALFTSRSFSAGGELSDFLPFPFAFPTEFLRPTSSWSLAPVGGATLAGRAAPAGRLSGGEASAARGGEPQVSTRFAPGCCDKLT